MGGTDCAAIQGVSSVQCREGVCEVRSCMSGWKVGLNGTLCERG